MVSWIIGLPGSLVKTATSLAMAPEKPAVSTSARTLPAVPGAMVGSELTTVQPQAGRTSRICNTWVPVLRRVNSCATLMPLATMPASHTGSGATTKGGGAPGEAAGGCGAGGAGCPGAAGA